MERRRGDARLPVLVGALVLAVAAPAVASHWSQRGWRHQHANYPPKPHGYAQIVDVFGQPCNDRANRNVLYWRAADNNVVYTVRFHKRLGGSTSTNLDNDVRGHIGNQHLDRYVRHGIYGFVCRDMRSGGSPSTHAWGIAVDVSSAAEPAGQCWSDINHHHDQIWRDHRWTWGRSWCDAMHFQYAGDY